MFITVARNGIFIHIAQGSVMNFARLVFVIFVVGLALVPSLITSYIHRTDEVEPEFEHDYR